MVFNTHEVEQALCSLNFGKADGVYSISSQLLRYSQFHILVLLFISRPYSIRCCFTATSPVSLVVVLLSWAMSRLQSHHY